MNRLMIATDLSARSDRALERAVVLAGDIGGQLSVVHIVDEDLPPDIAENHRRLAEETIREHLTSLPGSAGLEISVHVEFGRVYADILRLTESTSAVLLVLGTHREDAFKDIFRGTTAERVVRNGKIPVLVVSTRAVRSYRRVMVGIDFSIYSRRAIEFVTAFLPNAEFYFVHAYDVPFKGFYGGSDTQREVSKQHERHTATMIDEEMQVLEQSFKGAVPRFERVLSEGQAQEVIRREVERLRPDLLVVGTHGRTGVSQALLGSVAEDLLSNSPCDVLAVKAW